jgi:hypothetical protein
MRIPIERWHYDLQLGAEREMLPANAMNVVTLTLEKHEIRFLRELCRHFFATFAAKSSERERLAKLAKVHEVLCWGPIRQSLLF